MNVNTPPPPDIWRWRKSSYSEPNGGECIELGWRKSSYSQPNGDCVELAPALDAMRDSKNPNGSVLTIRALPALVELVKAGRFDR